MTSDVYVITERHVDFVFIAFGVSHLRVTPPVLTHLCDPSLSLSRATEYLRGEDYLFVPCADQEAMEHELTVFPSVKCCFKFSLVLTEIKDP
jgi:hypothetical protein